MSCEKLVCQLSAPVSSPSVIHLCLILATFGLYAKHNLAFLLSVCTCSLRIKSLILCIDGKCV